MPAIPSATRSVAQQYFHLFQQYVPVIDSVPPAFTTGYVAFSTIIYFVSFFTDINDMLALSPWSLLKLDLNRVSLYPLGHLSFFHLFFNMFSIIVPLAQFEKENGSVHCGIVLNVLATVVAIPYCLLGVLLYPDTQVIGASAWAFAFSAYEAHRQSMIKPKITITNSVAISTIYSPFIFLIACSILVPSSSFVGHLFGILSGYLLSFGYLTKMVEPPSKIVQFIETKLDFAINLIPSQFKYYREIECKALRDEKLKTNNITAVDNMVLPTHTTKQFQGQGHVLGS